MRSLLIAFLCICSTTLLADPPPPFSLVVDTANDDVDAINVYQANTRTIRASFLDAGQPENITNMVPFLTWATSKVAIAETTSTYSFVGSPSTGLVDFTFSATDLNTNGTFIYEVGLSSNSLVSTYHQGTFKITGSPHSVGVGVLTQSITVVDANAITNANLTQSTSNAVSKSGRMLSFVSNTNYPSYAYVGNLTVTDSYARATAAYASNEVVSLAVFSNNLARKLGSITIADGQAWDGQTIVYTNIDAGGNSKMYMNDASGSVYGVMNRQVLIKTGAGGFQIGPTAAACIQQAYGQDGGNLFLDAQAAMQLVRISYLSVVSNDSGDASIQLYAGNSGSAETNYMGKATLSSGGRASLGIGASMVTNNHCIVVGPQQSHGNNSATFTSIWLGDSDLSTLYTTWGNATDTLARAQATYASNNVVKLIKASWGGMLDSQPTNAYPNNIYESAIVESPITITNIALRVGFGTAIGDAFIRASYTNDDQNWTIFATGLTVTAGTTLNTSVTRTVTAGQTFGLVITNVTTATNLWSSIQYTVN